MRHYYHNKHNYLALLLEASKDKEMYSEQERNAILQAYYIVLCQEDIIYPFQKNLTNHPAEIRLEVKGYLVYIGCDRRDNHSTDLVYVELIPAPNNWISEYHLCGDRPIRIIWEPQNSYQVWKYDWETGEFVEGQEYAAEVWMSTGDTEDVSEEQFFQEVNRRRGGLALYEQFQKKIERVPSPEHMRDMNRIAAIVWQQEYVSHMWQISLLHEFLRRIMDFGGKRGLNSIRECIEHLEYETSEMELDQGHSGRMLLQIENERNRKICKWYVSWSGYIKKYELSHTYIVERNPFESLVFLFERGLHFGQKENALLPFYWEVVLDLRLSKLPTFLNRIFFDYHRIEDKTRQENSYFNSYPPTSLEKIEEFERHTGLIIPFEYKEMLLLSNGGHPSPCDFYNPSTDAVDSIGVFHGIGNGNFDLTWVCKEYQTRIPSNLFPIADVGGSLICLGIGGEYERKIWLWDSEEEDEALTEEQTNYSNVYRLADSFEDFIEKLR